MKKLISLLMAALIALSAVSCKKNPPGKDSDETKEIPVVVPEAVDLGIVVDGKTIKWASFNLGATKPEEYGDYYAWGETEPKEDYSWSAYKFGASSPFSKYNTEDNKTVLESGPDGDDVASKLLGGKWRMPTKAELSELVNNCEAVWITLNGVEGRKFTSKKAGYTEKWIFLPAAGSLDAPPQGNAGTVGDYWSSSRAASAPSLARSLSFTSGAVITGDSSRNVGLSVRPVYEE